MSLSRFHNQFEYEVFEVKVRVDEKCRGSRCAISPNNCIVISHLYELTDFRQSIGSGLGYSHGEREKSMYFFRLFRFKTEGRVLGMCLLVCAWFIPGFIMQYHGTIFKKNSLRMVLKVNL